MPAWTGWAVGKMATPRPAYVLGSPTCRYRRSGLSTPSSFHTIPCVCTVIWTALLDFMNGLSTRICTERDRRLDAARVLRVQCRAQLPKSSPRVNQPLGGEPVLELASPFGPTCPCWIPAGPRQKNVIRKSWKIFTDRKVAGSR